MTDETVYDNQINATKCYKCIHFPLCMVQKGGSNLGLASENDCMYFQPKPPKNSVVVTREEYNLLINIKKFFETADSEISAGNLLVYLEEFKEEVCKETAKEIINFIETLKVPEDGIHEWRDRHNETIERITLKLNQRFINGVEV